MSKEKAEKLAEQVAEMRANGTATSEIMKTLNITYAEYNRLKSYNKFKK